MLSPFHLKYHVQRERLLIFGSQIRRFLQNGQSSPNLAATVS
jgi:hypothetical protein